MDEKRATPSHHDEPTRRLRSQHRSAAAAIAIAAGLLLVGVAYLLITDDPAAEGGGTGSSTAADSSEANGSDASDSAAAAWQKVVPGGECECADGSDYAFWVRAADPTKVVFFLEGSGACFDAETCAFTGTGENDYYDFNLSTESPPDSGMFDFTRSDNPLADYTIVYVPLCTGDVYLGDTTREYSPELTVEHKGFANGTAALDYLAEHYTDAAQVAVIGKTAGGIAAPIYGGLAADLVPNANVVVFSAQSGSFPSDPTFNTKIQKTWGVHDTMPDWEVNKGLTAQEWGPTTFWIQAGLHNPDIVMARFDYAFDAHAARALEGQGFDPGSALELIDANEAAIEAAGVTQHSYTAPGDDHGLFEFEAFYDLEVNGVKLTSWLDALLSGEPLDDVRCQECGVQ